VTPPFRMRRPRLAEPLPADLAHVWRRINDERKVRAALEAERLGITIEQHLRARFALALRALTEARAPIEPPQ